MLEWVTQSHYLAYFEKNRVRNLDDGFKELFRLHWIEEAQHARIDALETLRAANVLNDEERLAAVTEFLTICDDLKPLLHKQAALDVESLERFRGKPLDEVERARVLDHQIASYDHVFIELGLENHQFRKVLTDVSPNAPAIVDAHLRCPS